MENGPSVQCVSSGSGINQLEPYLAPIPTNFQLQSCALTPSIVIYIVGYSIFINDLMEQIMESYPQELINSLFLDKLLI